MFTCHLWWWVGLAQLKQVRVMDPFTVKPLDWEAVRGHAAVCGGRVVTVEDHYPEVNIFKVEAETLPGLSRVVSEMLFWPASLWCAMSW